MPQYNFVCNICLNRIEKNLSIKDYFDLKKVEIKCEKCLKGVLSQEVVSVNSSVEKSQDQIIMESKEEVRKVVDKIRSGDSKTIDDIYGDRLNPYKK